MNMHGLGTYYKIGSDGQLVDCDSTAGIFQSVCWNPFAAVIPSDASGNPVSAPQPAPTGGISTTAILIIAAAAGFALFFGMRR